MTPKEKATQLCDAFYQKLPLEMYVTTTDGDLSWEYNSWKNAKECALIAVDEILIIQQGYAGNRDEFKTYLDYWQKVKQEIEKL
jgi:hypothetical protein